MHDQPREHLLHHVERDLLTGAFLPEVANQAQRVAVVEHADRVRLTPQRLQQLGITPVGVSHCP